MNLTDEDIAQVRDVVVSAIEALVLPRFDEHDKRFDALEQDVFALKEDVRVLQGDMRNVKETLNRFDGRLEAVEADIKELYRMVAQTTKHARTGSRFGKLSIEQKVVQMYEDVQLLAKEAGVTLPH